MHAWPFCNSPYRAFRLIYPKFLCDICVNDRVAARIVGRCQPIASAIAGRSISDCRGEVVDQQAKVYEYTFKLLACCVVRVAGII
jgi:hypothetical protein